MSKGDSAAVTSRPGLFWWLASVGGCVLAAAITAPSPASPAADAPWVVRGLLVCAIVGVACRALRVALVVDSRGLTVRNTFRTVRIPWAIGPRLAGNQRMLRIWTPAGSVGVEATRRRYYNAERQARFLQEIMLIAGAIEREARVEQERHT